jgi:hypothetical protein
VVLVALEALLMSILRGAVLAAVAGQQAALKMMVQALEAVLMVAAQDGLLREPVAPAQSVLSGPATLVHSHQLALAHLNF